MDSSTRKLDPSAVSHSLISSNTSSALTKRHDFNDSKINDDHSFSSNGAASCTYGGFNAYKLSQPLDYSMALTVLLLLTALFFIGFFSVYIRRFSGDSSVSLRRLSGEARTKNSKGVNPKIVDSMPIYRYDVTMESECSICLSEFEDGECVKAVPFCGHVFHVQCIDTWLASHVTCPLCRTARLLKEEGGEVRVVIGCDAGGSQD